MTEDRLFQKVYGCLIGGLIGDAAGAPVEGKHYREIEAQLGEITDFAGSGTDDSAIKLILCEAILANDGWVTADEFADSFLKHPEHYKLFFIPVKNMLHKVKAGLALPVYAGLGNMQSSSSAMAISPMGLINACNPRQAAAETYDVAGLIHAGDTTFCRDGACAIAAAVAEAMRPEATVDSVVEASTAYLHRKSSRVMVDKIGETLSLARAVGEYKGFRKEFYERFLQDIICDSRETVPCALALFKLAGGDPVKSILYGANFGRDADTISTMVGAISGALKGYTSLKPEWLERIRSANPEQAELAAKLVKAIRARADSVKRSLAMIEELVG